MWKQPTKDKMNKQTIIGKIFQWSHNIKQKFVGKSQFTKKKMNMPENKSSQRRLSLFDAMSNIEIIHILGIYVTLYILCVK